MLRTVLLTCMASVAIALSGAVSAAAVSNDSPEQSACPGAQSSFEVAGVLLPKRTRLVIDYRRTRLA